MVKSLTTCPEPSGTATCSTETENPKLLNLIASLSRLTPQQLAERMPTKRELWLSELPVMLTEISEDTFWESVLLEGHPTNGPLLRYASTTNSTQIAS